MASTKFQRSALTPLPESVTSGIQPALTPPLEMVASAHFVPLTGEERREVQLCIARHHLLSPNEEGWCAAGPSGSVFVNIHSGVVHHCQRTEPWCEPGEPNEDQFLCCRISGAVLSEQPYDTVGHELKVLWEEREEAEAGTRASKQRRVIAKQAAVTGETQKRKRPSEGQTAPPEVSPEPKRRNKAINVYVGAIKGHVPAGQLCKTNQRPGPGSSVDAKLLKVANETIPSSLIHSVVNSVVRPDAAILEASRAVSRMGTAAAKEFAAQKQALLEECEQVKEELFRRCRLAWTAFIREKKMPRNLLSRDTDARQRLFVVLVYTTSTPSFVDAIPGIKKFMVAERDLHRMIQKDISQTLKSRALITHQTAFKQILAQLGGFRTICRDSQVPSPPVAPD